MARAIIVLFVLALVLAGCAAGPQMTLDQIQRHFTVVGEKSSVMDNVRMFTIREQLKITSFEEETGRIIAFRNVILSRQEEAKQLIMHLTIVSTPGGTCDVDARFVFGDAPGSLTKEQENLLVSYYMALYDHLGVRP